MILTCIPCPLQIDVYSCNIYEPIANEMQRWAGTLSGRSETNNFHYNKIADVPGKITLPLIGLVSYKFNGSMWTSNQHHEKQLTTSLLKAADDWLCQRQVDHPDYCFFLSH